MHRRCLPIPCATCLLQDGEVDEFMLRNIEEVARLVSDTKQFKPNCALVITDFLVRGSKQIGRMSSAISRKGHKLERLSDICHAV